MFGISKYLKWSIAKITKHENETFELCSKYAISKKEAESIQKAYHKYSSAIRHPISLDEFTACIMNFDNTHQ